MELSDSHLDILKEIGSIGSGQAATSLSVMLNKRINVIVEKVAYVTLKEFTALLGGEEKLVVIVYCEISGEISGMMHFILTRENALKLIDSLMGRAPGSTKIIEFIDESMFKEVTNIIFGAYLSSLSNMLGLKVLFSVPYWAYDLAGALMESTLIKTSNKVEKILSVKTTLYLQNRAIEGQLITVFDDETLARMINVIEEKYLQKTN